MKRLLILGFAVLCIQLTFAQSAAVSDESTSTEIMVDTMQAFPTEAAAGNLYLGTDSYFYYNFNPDNNLLGGRLGLAGQYFLNETFSLGFVAGVGGNRSASGDTTYRNVIGERSFSAGINATYYPESKCRQACYQPFIRTQLTFSRGRSTYDADFGELIQTSVGGISLGIAPGLMFQLKNDALLNVSATLIGVSSNRTGSGTFAFRRTSIFGGINSGVGVEYIKQF